MAKYWLYGGISCQADFLGEYEFDTIGEAEEAAWNMVVEEYQCYEGFNGLRTEYEIAKDLWEDNNECEFDWDSVSMDDDFMETVHEAYLQEVESWVDYWVTEAIPR